MRLELPYPPKELNPNKRLHWAKASKAKKAYRNQVYWMAQGRELKDFKLKITFHPPDRRKRDRDNCIAAFKAGQDGLADAWGVDDSIFEITYTPLGEPVKNGAVIIESRGLIVDVEA